LGLRLEGLQPCVSPPGGLLPPTPWPTGLRIDVVERLPQPQRAIATGQGWPVLQGAPVEVEPEGFLVARIRAHTDEETMARFGKAGRAVHAVDPAIDRRLAHEAVALPRRQCCVPALLQPPECR
jgi:hypothetical protein